MIKKVIIKIIEKLLYKKFGLHVKINYANISTKSIAEGKTKITVDSLEIDVIDDELVAIVEKIK